MLADIGSRAVRLKSNLALPKVDEKKEKSNSELTTAAALKDRLMEFDRVVMSFATNPIFQQANVIDVELAKQASGDLATIIERSGKLKKAAATLAKK